MLSEDYKFIAEVLGVSFLITMAILLTGLFFFGSSVEQQAVDRGAARWVIDPSTGEKSLEWCDCFGSVEGGP